MRTTLRILSLSLLTSIPAACDDAEPTRPADGTVKVWESCVWDGQVTPTLCEVDLSCSSNGVCSPVCETIADCPEFGGFDKKCIQGDDERSVCKIMCDAMSQCPNTEGVTLHCLDFYCIGDL
jgi:hypothetical protein